MKITLEVSDRIASVDDQNETAPSIARAFIGCMNTIFEWDVRQVVIEELAEWLDNQKAIYRGVDDAT
jgi:hypothetical protein